MPKIPYFPIQIKVWGWTQTLFLSDKVEVAFAHMHKDFQCSKHLHTKKWNRFHVISGELEIIAYRNEQEERIILSRGMTLDVEPGLKHRMVSKTDVDLIEIYWVDDGELDASDIVRDDNGSKVSNDLVKVEIALPTILPFPIQQIPNVEWPPIVDEPEPYKVVWNSLPDNMI